MPRTKTTNGIAPKQTKLKPSTTKTGNTSHTIRIKELEATVKALQTRLNQEKDDHQESLSKITALQSENAQQGGLRMKRMRDEIEDLKEKLELELAATGRLKIQLRHEREHRLKRDGTEGFLAIWKNDPEKWMADSASISVGRGGAGGSKPKHVERGGSREAVRGNQREVVDEDVMAEKKKENDAFAALRKESVDEDDEEVLPEEMRIKLEEKMGTSDSKKTGEKMRTADEAPLVADKSQDVMDIDDLF